MSQAKDYTYLIGTKVNKWSVISIHKRFIGDRKRVLARATCECGKIKSVLVENIVSGHSKSCGCRVFPYQRKNCVVVAYYNGKFDGFCTCGLPFKAKSRAQVNKGFCCHAPVNKGVKGKYDCLNLSKVTLRSLHDRWRAMRQRCRQDGVELEPSWCDFKKWVADVGVPDSLSYWFMRLDPNRGWVNGNCGWFKGQN